MLSTPRKVHTLNKYTPTLARHKPPELTPTSYWNAFLLPPATKLGQGYVFTDVCDSVHGGGTVHAGIPLPRDQAHPPGTRHNNPGPGTPPHQDQVPPGTEHAGRYGQRAGGTHPTGMQSCLKCIATIRSHYH